MDVLSASPHGPADRIAPRTFPLGERQRLWHPQAIRASTSIRSELAPVESEVGVGVGIGLDANCKRKGAILGLISTAIKCNQDVL